MKKLNLLFIFFLSLTSAYSQLVVNSGGNSPLNYLTTGLLGSGVQVSNVQFNNSPNYSGSQLGTFTYTGSQIPMSSGLVIGNGNVVGLTGPNSSGSYGVSLYNNIVDVDLQTLAGQSIYDVGKLEFDFIPIGNNVSFSFMFGSDEYNEFVCSNFNDVFGFFVTGTNPNGPAYNSTNLATVPGTNIPITINTINNGTTGSGSTTLCDAADPNWVNNSIYFMGAPGNHFEADGMTQKITVTFPVVCGETYHFKIGIADGFDTSYDSWVILEGGSFTSPGVDVQIATTSGSNRILEGCGTADIIFRRPSNDVANPLTVTYTIGGTATQGVDYPNLQNPIVFPAGIDSVGITISPFADGIPEGVETVIITVVTISDCGDTLISTGTIEIYDDPILSISTPDVQVLCWGDSIPITTTPWSENAPFTYVWTEAATGNILPYTGNTMYGSIHSNTTITYYVSATDICGYTVTDTVHLSAYQTLEITDLFQVAASACNSDGLASAIVAGVTGMPHYLWKGPGSTMPYDSIMSSLFMNIPSGWYYFSITDDVCQINDSIFVEETDPPTAILTPSGIQGCSPYEVTFGNDSENAVEYTWNVGSGFEALSPSKDGRTITFYETTTIYLVAQLNPNCKDTASVTIEIVACGCTNPDAFNYDPLAVVDDGSCILPNPIVSPPNVFTPNGDGANDQYTVLTLNVKTIEFNIFNRWGNIVYSSSTLPLVWDGKSDGTAVSDGTYFYMYKAKSFKDEEIEGHGFIQLIGK